MRIDFVRNNVENEMIDWNISSMEWNDLVSFIPSPRLWFEHGSVRKLGTLFVIKSCCALRTLPSQ